MGILLIVGSHLVTVSIGVWLDLRAIIFLAPILALLMSAEREDIVLMLRKLPLGYRVWKWKWCPGLICRSSTSR
jgi:hypothetical protein